jgi:hypothetical protein
LGRRVYTGIVRVSAGASAVVRVNVSGRLPRGTIYTLAPVRQTVVTPDVLDVRLHVAPDCEITASGGTTVRSTKITASAAWTLDDERELSVSGLCSRSGFLGLFRRALDTK